LHHLLTGREALEDVVSDGLLLDALDERADHLEIDVGLEESDAHLAERLLDVLLGQAAGTPEAVEDRLKALRQGFEHWVLSESREEIAKSTEDYGASEAASRMPPLPAPGADDAGGRPAGLGRERQRGDEDPVGAAA